MAKGSKKAAAAVAEPDTLELEPRGDDPSSSGAPQSRVVYIGWVLAATAGLSTTVQSTLAALAASASTSCFDAATENACMVHVHPGSDTVTAVSSLLPDVALPVTMCRHLPHGFFEKQLLGRSESPACCSLACRTMLVRVTRLQTQLGPQRQKDSVLNGKQTALQGKCMPHLGVATLTKPGTSPLLHRLLLTVRQADASAPVTQQADGQSQALCIPRVPIPGGCTDCSRGNGWLLHVQPETTRQGEAAGKQGGLRQGRAVKGSAAGRAAAGQAQAGKAWASSGGGSCSCRWQAAACVFH